MQQSDRRSEHLTLLGMTSNTRCIILKLAKCYAHMPIGYWLQSKCNCNSCGKSRVFDRGKLKVRLPKQMWHWWTTGNINMDADTANANLFDTITGMMEIPTNFWFLTTTSSKKVFELPTLLNTAEAIELQSCQHYCDSDQQPDSAIWPPKSEIRSTFTCW